MTETAVLEMVRLASTASLSQPAIHRKMATPALGMFSFRKQDPNDVASAVIRRLDILP